MTRDDDQDRATDALRQAAEMTARLRSVALRRVRGYLIGWAVAGVALVLAIGLLGRIGAIVGLAAWPVAVAVGARWFRRSGAFAAAGSVQVKRGTAGWIGIYAVVIAVGSGGPVTDAWFWIIGGLATAFPLMAAAVRCGRVVVPPASA